MKILALPKYGRQAASTRQRMLQYIPSLAAAGMSVESHPLLTNSYVQSIATGVPFSRIETARSYASRLALLLRKTDADAIWIYAELFPFLPGLVEKIAFLSGKPVVYDFDDAFFHAYDKHPNAFVRLLLSRKLEPLIRGAAACTCGNAYLEAYARSLNRTTLLLPTVVDETLYRPRAARVPGPPVVGWIGSPSTYRFVRPLLPMLGQLVQRHRIKVRIVGAGSSIRAEDRLPGIEFRAWSEATEVPDVQAMDVGIMPLPDEEWTRGKSGYKLIQYMACGLPVIASPVGVNADLIEHGETGLLAATPEEWRDGLTFLICDEKVRGAFGRAGLERFRRKYSLSVHAPRLAELFRAVGGPRVEASSAAT